MVISHCSKQAGLSCGVQSNDPWRGKAGPGAAEQCWVDAAAQLMSPSALVVRQAVCCAQWRQDFLGAFEANGKKNR